MSHIGLICPPVNGHLHPTCGLGRELRSRGHRVTLISLADAERFAVAADLNFHPLGLENHVPGQLSREMARLGELSGVAALAETIRLFKREFRLHLKELAPAVKSYDFDALVVDQTTVLGGTAADIAGIPFVTLGNAVLVDPDPGIPPCLYHWRYRESRWAHLRNSATYWLFDVFATTILRRINRYRREHGLRALASPQEFKSPHATLSQLFPQFEFPRVHPSPKLHLTGPLSTPTARAPVPFPYERLDGRPLVYASMGTQQNRQRKIFEKIAAACAELPVQLVISQGRADAEPLEGLKGSPIVVPFAPQLDLLQRAALTITHAGLNTALESLAAGVPMVAIPITNDQPGVAARIEWSGAGEAIIPRWLTVPRLRSAIERVLHNPSYREAALRLQSDMKRAGGASRACDVIEQVVGHEAVLV